LSRYAERLLVLYNSKMELSNKPSYMEDLKELLKLDGLIDEEGNPVLR
jgi:hypothetical protein